GIGRARRQDERGSDGRPPYPSRAPGSGGGHERQEAGMQVGMIGLGRMGANMVRRLLRGGHTCVVHDVSAAAVQALVREGATGATSLDAFVEQLAKPRVVWLMVPAGVVDATLENVAPPRARGDVIVDGWTALSRDDVDRAGRLAATGSTTWTAAPAAACSGSSAATAS